MTVYDGIGLLVDGIVVDLIYDFERSLEQGCYFFKCCTKSTTLENVAWSYENPKEDVARIKDHLAFYSVDQVTVEQI